MEIKQQTSDFLVEEIIDYEIDEKGEYTYFWLTKENWTTMRAVSIIAKLCRTSHKRFKFAGTKDKFAITKQLVSAWKIEPEQLEKIKLRQIEIKVIGKGKTPISLGTLKGNKFEIIIRDLSGKEIINIKNNYEKIKKRGFVNYFGGQRFGKGNTHLIGKEILKGNLEKAVKELVLFTGKNEAKESQEARKLARKNWGRWKEIINKLPRHLNIEKAVLNHLIKEPNDFAGALRKVPKTLRKLYVHAIQAFIFNSALKESGIREGEIEIPGYETKLGKDKYSQNVKKILEKEKIKLEDFKCKRMPELASKGEKRKIIIKPKRFKVKIEENTAKLQFELAKGSYATVLINHLLV